MNMSEFWKRVNTTPGPTVTLTKAELVVLWEALDTTYRAKAFDSLPHSVQDRIRKALGL